MSSSFSIPSFLLDSSSLLSILAERPVLADSLDEKKWRMGKSVIVVVWVWKGPLFWVSYIVIKSSLGQVDDKGARVDEGVMGRRGRILRKKWSDFEVFQKTSRDKVSENISQMQINETEAESRSLNTDRRFPEFDDGYEINQASRREGLRWRWEALSVSEDDGTSNRSMNQEALQLLNELNGEAADKKARSREKLEVYRRRVLGFFEAKREGCGVEKSKDGRGREDGLFSKQLKVLEEKLITMDYEEVGEMEDSKVGHHAPFPMATRNGFE
nr:hypothetical protein Iba_chr07aCG15520 [Ipomoea batatas]